MMDISMQFKKAFDYLKKHQRIVIILLILGFASIAFFEQLKRVLIVIIFIAVASASKLYHKLFRSTVVVDFVLFLTLMTSLVYENKILGYVVGFTTVLLSDYFANKLSYHSLVSLAGITLVITAGALLSSIHLQVALVILVILYEIYAVIVYYLMGSTVNQIAIFLVSHFISNMIMIFSFAGFLRRLMG